ncbi:MAG: glycosyltransferase family 4 protein [Candidatus Gastranaerophilales bacterium]|nr:glycosyltransferase family 4 protein [Candidatus Gastranaerophilales bacterium]
MKIAQLAPLWESVPPKTYGGTELVVHLLCEEFIKYGHDVTLFACGDSKTSARLEAVIKKPMREMNVEIPSFYEIDSISRLLKRHREFDIIHNHIGYPFLPFTNLITTPVVTTLHGAFCNKEEVGIYRRHKNNSFISISNSQRLGLKELNYIQTVYNGIAVEKYDFQETPDTKNPYLAFLGRISEEKGVHHTIKIAKDNDFKLIIAGKIGKVDEPYYEEKIKPFIDGKQISYIGELGHNAKVEFLKNATATLHTVTWPEPFGLVMAESMACGTPVLALRNGSIPEVVKDRVTGFIEDDANILSKHVKDIHKIDRKACRKHVEDNFSAGKMAQNYLKAYEKTLSISNLSGCTVKNV